MVRDIELRPRDDGKRDEGLGEAVRRPEPWSPVWWEQSGLTAMLASLVLALFVGGPIGAIRGGGQPIFDVFFSLFLVSGVVAFSRHRRLAIAVAVRGIAALAARWARYGAAEGISGRLDSGLSIATLIIFPCLVLQHVFRNGPP